MERAAAFSNRLNPPTIRLDMSFASLKAAFKSVFNSPEEEIERRMRESDSDADMSIGKGITEEICFHTWQKGVDFVRLKETDFDRGTLYYVSDEGEESCGELPIEQTITLAKRIRVLANIDGWGHSDTTPNQMLVEAKDRTYRLTVTHFQLKPEINVLMKVEHVVRP